MAGQNNTNLQNRVIDKYNARISTVQSLVCVGLDSDYERLPARFLDEAQPQFAFNRWLIDLTHEFVSAYKPNMAFYEARGDVGLQELKLTVEYLRDNHPDILTICDAKRGDIGSTNEGYVTAIFDWLGFDAVTLHPYLGGEALQPFLERADKACIILCRTSNPGSGELQNLIVDGKPFWEIVAEKTRDRWNARENCMLVMGATYPEEIRRVRSIVGDMPLLIPGIGAQGGNLEQTVRFGLDSAKRGLIINSSRGVIFADDPRLAVQQLRDVINEYRGV
ncbi:MAG TPA: orotidine-5'-phosphate decarboxylase [Phototrophicaceae bacterium]|nr:orotidine-5'-phosphate decarboxylase [Phototrophicaceae bacterium]